MQVISIFLLMASISQSALASSYSVTLREFGFNRTNCDGDIAKVAESFAADANVILLSSGCLPPGMGELSPSGKFSYASPNWVETTTSDVREARGLDGYYQSIAECESARLFEQSTFSRLTGLSPYVGYCYQASHIGAPRYRVRLDAVGISAVKKHSISASWMNRAVHETGLVSDVTSMLASTGGEVIAATVDRDVSGYFAAVDYYHQDEFHLHSQELLFWHSAELCQETADSMNRQWPNDAPKSIFHCTATAGGTIRLLQVYLSNNIFSGFDFDTEEYATAYSSQVACMSDASRIRTALEQSGTTVLGMICGQENTLRLWRLAVFSQAQ